jgi:peptidoglycan/xylan/chitin deacetylase (PgdA/CDA1 family)
VRPLVLCYHAVSPSWEHRLSMPGGLLLRQVQALSRLRRVHVTFDDAYRSSVTVFSQLQDLRVPITVFVCTSFALRGSPLAIPELAGDEPDELATMDWDELRCLCERGIEIGSHGVHHARLPLLSDAELQREVQESKTELEAELGRPCTDFAYPYGEHDERVRAAVRSAGYERGFALWGGQKGDPFALPRLDLYRRHSPARAILMTTPLHRFAAGAARVGA